MRIRFQIRAALILLGCALGWLTTTGPLNGVFAQEVNPETSTNERAQLPQPDPQFEGNIGKTYQDSTPDYPQPINAPDGAPNVLIILLDDVGFGMCSTFGGPVPTPNMQKLAENGLSYTRFHTTALCSPTRAALLAGRNHHSVGTGVIIEMGTGYPGYTGIIPRNTALISEMLKSNGYATSMFGKWHNTPEPDISPAGPFDRWPTGLGFDYFYGFNQGETHQYYPVIYRNTNWAPQPKSPEEGYHFTADMTDEAIEWIRNIRAADRNKPWFCYFSTGAVHAPHHAPQEWLDNYKGKFDHGWDKQREITHAKQLEMGIIPEGTMLTPRPESIPAWDDQPEDAKTVYKRLMENYAAFMAHTDHHVGRLIDSLEASGELENTLIFYIVGDNGASAEGGLEGTFSELASLLGLQLGLQSTINRLDEIGGPTSEPHVPVGWAWAMSAPFQWTKQVASHFGGTRNPMIVHWPKGIEARGQQRLQFHHVIDVVPTILEACKIPEPKEVNGIPQKPIEGISMLYTFDDKSAEGRRKTQYFEMMTNRAIYHDGWMASSAGPPPWQTGGRTIEALNNATWELYNIEQDFSQANDLAAKHPEKLKELQTKFTEEANKYNVFPLDPRLSERLDPKLRVTGEPPTSWTYYGNEVWLPEPVGPQLFPRAHTITASLEIPKGGAEGVIACSGSFSVGWTLFIKDGKPQFRYQCVDLDNVEIAGTVAIPEGQVELKTEFIPDPASKTDGGVLRLYVNGKPAGEGTLTRTVFRHGLEPFEIGRDSITPIAPAYEGKGSFEFTGKINQVEFSVKPSPPPGARSRPAAAGDDAGREAPAAPGPAMVRIAGGIYTIGSDDPDSLPNERPARQVEVQTFWMDVTPVTNAQFQKFVKATGYITTAERPVDWEELKKQLPPGTPKPPAENLQPGAIVFVPPEQAVPLEDLSRWFVWTDGASWRAPEGPGSDIKDRMDHPVVQVSWDDARAYAKWAGKRLPTEAEWEVAARGGLEGKRFFWGNTFKPEGRHMANTFTGTFPHRNTAADGFAGRAPVASFPPNGYGLHDMAGNVWQWTADVYIEKPGGRALPGDPRRVMKGGSYLCHVDYCESYRPTARRGTPYDTGTSHIGFRCASDRPPVAPAEPTDQAVMRDAP